ncbi:MAG TPA: hypothetical protein P5267_02280 [Patescibacteria group bacterium]|nr:hypothetical protein [Patescibacteria group bacterium]
MPHRYPPEYIQTALRASQERKDSIGQKIDKFFILKSSLVALEDAKTKAGQDESLTSQLDEAIKRAKKEMKELLQDDEVAKGISKRKETGDIEGQIQTMKEMIAAHLLNDRENGQPKYAPLIVIDSHNLPTDFDFVGLIDIEPPSNEANAFKVNLSRLVGELNNKAGFFTRGIHELNLMDGGKEIKVYKGKMVEAIRKLLEREFLGKKFDISVELADLRESDE